MEAACDIIERLYELEPDERYRRLAEMEPDERLRIIVDSGIMEEHIDRSGARGHQGQIRALRDLLQKMGGGWSQLEIVKVNETVDRQAQTYNKQTGAWGPLSLKKDVLKAAYDWINTDVRNRCRVTWGQVQALEKIIINSDAEFSTTLQMSRGHNKGALTLMPPSGSSQNPVVVD